VADGAAIRVLAAPPGSLPRSARASRALPGSGNQRRCLARALLLLHQVRRRQGEHGPELDALLDRGLALATSEETRSLFLQQKGNLLSEEGRSREAEGLLREALDIIEKTWGRDHPDYEMALLTLGCVLSEQGRYIEAEGFLRQALAIADQMLSLDHPGASLHALAELLLNQGRDSEAEALLRQSLAVTVQALGPEHPSSLRELLALATMWARGERDQEAEPLLREVLAVTERALGREHRAYASALCALSEVLENRGHYAEAEEILCHAIDILERTWGRFHPDYAESQQRLAEVLEHQGRLVEAEGLRRQSLGVLEEALGCKSLTYGRALSGLARVLENQDRHEEAEALLRESLAIAEDTLGPDHPDLCPRLVALALNLEGRQDQEGEPLLVRALTLAVQAYGPDHPHVAQTLVPLCRVQQRLDRPEFVDTAGLALAAMVKSLGPEHPRTQESVPFLRQILVDGAVRSALAAREAAERREIETAISLQERAVGLIRQLGEDRNALFWLSTLLFNLAAFYQQADRLEDAARALEEVGALDERKGHENLDSDRKVLEEARQLAGFLRPEDESSEIWRQDLKQLEGKIAAAASLALAGRMAPDSLRLHLQGMLAMPPQDGEGPLADFAAYIRAVAARLGGEPVPPVPAAYAFSIAWIGGRGLERADPLRRLLAEAEAAAERGDEAEALAAQEEAVALARQAGEAREALIRLSILLFNLAHLYQSAGRFADAVWALEEVVALDERTEYEDLDSDRAVLEEARQLAARGFEGRESLAED
jgi:tetratricopeptide (TPR) repeat protein